MSALADLVAGGAWLPFLAALAAKATLVLAATAALAALLWRASAAARHLVWCLGILGVLALPVLTVALPAWELPLLPAVPPAAEWTAGEAAPAAEAKQGPVLASPAPTGLAVVTETPAGDRLARAALGVAAAGVLAGLLWLALGFWGATRLGRRAEVVRDPEWLRVAHEASDRLGLRRPVLLLKSRGPAMPATWGLLWPSVVLPASADRWPDDLRRAVLAHELAHVKRFDCLTQTLAQVACVLFWWHPVVWYAAGRLRVERERACDDLVLGAGARASDYAAHLLEIARTHRAMRLSAPAMVSMAKPSHLESRLLWVLDAARPRTAPSAAVRLATAAAALLVVGPLAAMRPSAPAPQPASPALASTALQEEAEDPPQLPEAEGEGEGVAGGRAEASPLPSGSHAAAADTPRDGRVVERVVERLVEMRAVGVTPEYVAEMRAAGLGPLTADQLVEMRAVGVTPAFLAGMRSRGYDGLSVEDATGMAAVGVTPAYVEEMNAAGFGRLSAGELVGLRAVGVTAEYLAGLRRHGIVPRDVEEAQGLRAVGVTGEYVEQMRALAPGRLDAEALTELRAVGVTPAYVRELESVGLTGLTLRQLVELRAHGVTAAYVREMEAAGFGPLTREQLVRLRASGVDRDLARSRARARTP